MVKAVLLVFCLSIVVAAIIIVVNFLNKRIEKQEKEDVKNRKNN